MTSRVLLAAAALSLAAGGVMHARAFAGTDAAVAASNLPAFYGNSLRALWLSDSAILLILAVLYVVVAVRPTMASRVVVLTALIPAATAACLYVFLGKSFAAHLLMGASGMVVAALLLLPRSAAR